MRRHIFAVFMSGLLILSSDTISAESDTRLDFAGQVWMHVASRWESPPPEAELDETFASAKLVRLNLDHKFAMIYCKVIKQQRGISISLGDGIMIFRGEWKERPDGIHVHYKQSYSSIVPARGNSAIKAMTARVFSKGKSLILDGEEFLPAADLHLDDFDQLAGEDEGKLQ
jgi:hypothetical protein